jgi:Bacterial Ig-like domain
MMNGAAGAVGVALALFAYDSVSYADCPAGPKAYITVFPKDLSLVWNADQGESGRGRGEVFVSIWVHWPSCVEGADPQHREYGPLGDDGEFPSGNLVETPPPGSGTWTITPATVAVVGEPVYHNKANCPVADYIEVYALVWESDSNKELNDYVKTLKEAVDEAAKDAGDAIQGLSFVQVATAGAQVLIDVLTSSSDDKVGRFIGVVPIPNPCPAVFTVERELELENLAAALWTDVEAEDESGENFGDEPYGISPPSSIGTLRLKIIGGPQVNEFCNAVVTTNGSLSTDLVGFDIGQPDEANVSAVLATAACIPSTSIGATYRVAFDTDNNPFSGCPLPGLVGGEFVASCTVGGDGNCVSQLLRWDPPSSSLVVVPGGIYDAAFDIDRQAVLINVLRQQLGMSSGQLAARGSVTMGALNPVSQLPQAGQQSLMIPVSPLPSQVFPIVAFNVPGGGTVDIDVDQPFEVVFSKAMNRPQTTAATHLQPSVPTMSNWFGNRLVVQPLVPLNPDSTYQLRVEPFAVDTVNMPIDGNGNGVPGDPFVATFRTEPLPIVLLDTLGNETGAFAEGEPISMSFDPPRGLPFGAAAYVVLDVLRGIAPGTPLQDSTDNGPDALVVDAATVALGSVAEEGEYHVVLDLDGDGVYSPPTDRIDQNHIGFAVLPDCDNSGEIDAVEIGAGILADSDGDGTPDVCEAPACPADFDNDGDVDGADLAVMLGAWGTCSGCAADIVPDGSVNGADLGVLLGAWGSCG